MRIEPRRSFTRIDELLRRTSNPAHRAMLENFKAHLAAEISGDLEGVMETMSPHPVYHAYGTRELAGRSVAIIDGREQNAAFYRKTFDQRRHVFELEIDRLAVADWGIAGDGIIRTITPGAILARRGVEVDDEAANYLVSYRMAWFLPYAGGLMDGEDTYSDPSSTEVLKLDAGDVLTADEALA